MSIGVVFFCFGLVQLMYSCCEFRNCFPSKCRTENLIVVEWRRLLSYRKGIGELLNTVEQPAPVLMQN